MWNNSINRYGNANTSQGYFGGKSRNGFPWHNQLSKHRRDVFMVDTEYFGATTQPRVHCTYLTSSACQASTPWGNHTITHFRGTVTTINATTTHNFLKFNTSEMSSNNSEKNSANWQINTSLLFSYTRLIQVPRCTVTRSAILARVKVRIQFFSLGLILLNPKTHFRGQRLRCHLRKANNMIPFCLSPDQGDWSVYSPNETRIQYDIGRCRLCES